MKNETDYDLRNEQNKGYVDLGYAIVLQAVEDVQNRFSPKIFKDAYCFLKKETDTVKILCGMSGEFILNQIGIRR
jgi:hypothetical protein